MEYLEEVTTDLRLAGKHSMKFGGEYHLMRYASFGRGNGQGTYSFTRSWTSSNPQVNDAGAGNAIASFLLGDLNSASANQNSTPYITSRYPTRLAAQQPVDPQPGTALGPGRAAGRAV
jgi:hypothetical protein